MKRIINTFLLAILCFPLMSQSFTSFEEIRYNVGDTVVFGYKSNPKTGIYQHIKEYNYNNSIYSGVPIDNFGKYAIIIDIIKDDNIFYNYNDSIIVVGKKGLRGFKLFVNINEAIKSGEVISLYDRSLKPDITTPAMSDTATFVLNVLVNKVDLEKNIIDSYLREFDKEYRNYANDEFAYNEKLAESEPYIRTLINNYDTTTKYYINHKVSFGEYNFDNNSFDITYYPEDEYELGAFFIGFNKYNRKLKLVNIEEFKKIRIDPTIANKFIKRRKNEYGKINRNVYLKVFITPLFKDKIAKGEGNIPVVIEKIEFYDFENRQYSLLGILKLN